MAVARLHKGQG